MRTSRQNDGDTLTKSEHTLKLSFGRVVPESSFARSGCISEFRTHKCHQLAYKFDTNPLEPVLGSETHISREESFSF